jgi:anti-sigma regulatory factor (Ser/Thr protein kinase)
MEDLSLHILDIAENAIEARARRIWLCIDQEEEGDRLTLEIRDDGRGMDARALQRATDPFFTTRTARRVGLGLSLLSEAASATGGTLSVESSPGEGTRVSATFHSSHIDMKPLGDIPRTVVTLLAGHPEVELFYSHTTGERSFCMDSGEIAARLGGLSISSPPVLRWIEGQIRRGVADLTGGAGP